MTDREYYEIIDHIGYEIEKINLTQEEKEKLKQAIKKIVSTKKHMEKEDVQEIVEDKITILKQIMEKENRKEKYKNKARKNFVRGLLVGTAGTLGIGAGVAINLKPEEKGYPQFHVSENLQGEREDFQQIWQEVEQDYNDYQILMAQDKSDLTPAQKAEIQVLEEHFANNKESIEKMLLKVAKNVITEQTGKETKQIYIVARKLGSSRYVYNDGSYSDEYRVDWPDIKNELAEELMREYEISTGKLGLKQYKDKVKLQVDGEEKIQEYQKELAVENIERFEKVSQAQEKLMQKQNEKNQEDDER